MHFPKPTPRCSNSFYPATIVHDLCQSFIERHTQDAARSLEQAPVAEIVSLLSGMTPSTITAAIVRLNPGIGSQLVAQLPTGVQSKDLKIMETGKVTTLLHRIEPGIREDILEHILEQLSPEKRDMLRRLLRYPENTAGARMDPFYPCLSLDLTVSAALEQVQGNMDQKAMYWFTITRDHELVGVVSLRDLLSPAKKRRLTEVQQGCSSRISAFSDLANIPADHELIRQGALPVVDERNVYLGALTLEALVDAGATGELNDSLQVAGSALGELYWIGLFGLIHSLDPGKTEAPSLGGVRS